MMMLRLILLRMHRVMMGMHAVGIGLDHDGFPGIAGRLRTMHHRGCGHVGERQRDA